MEISLGMSEADAASEGWRGTDEGYQMKSTSGWSDNGDGSNSSGFNGLPGGMRREDAFQYMGERGYWWPYSESGSYSWLRLLYNHAGFIDRHSNPRQYGFSARCVRD